MFQENIAQLWQSHNREVREALVDTVVWALNMEVVFTEEQLIAAMMCIEGLFGVSDDTEMLNYLKPAVGRVNEWGFPQAIEEIVTRVAFLSLAERESVMTVAIIAFQFLADDDERPPMNESLLPHLSVALDVVNSVPRLLADLRATIGGSEQSAVSSQQSAVSSQQSAVNSQQ